MYYHRGVIFGYLVLTALALLALAISCMIIYVLFWQCRNFLCPIQTIHTSVIRKKAKQWNTLFYFENEDATASKMGLYAKITKYYSRFIYKLGISTSSLTQGTDCYVTFSDNSKELEFNVPMSVYMIAEEGAEGMLTFQGEKFKGFTPMTSNNKDDLIIYKSEM
ncbi:MAG: DUF2500 family protein [Armatimonadota bacterium]